MDKWTKNFPTEPGWYWFYGQQFKCSKPKLQAVRAFMGGNSLVMVCAGSFMYECEVGEMRWFKPMDTPGPDELESLR